MIFDELLRPFVERRPVAVMARACLEHAFAADDLEALFTRVATAQYERTLTFAALVDLLAAVVTRRSRPFTRRIGPTRPASASRSPACTPSSTPPSRAWPKRW